MCIHALVCIYSVSFGVSAQIKVRRGLRCGLWADSVSGAGFGRRFQGGSGWFQKLAWRFWGFQCPFWLWIFLRGFWRFCVAQRFRCGLGAACPIIFAVGDITWVNCLWAPSSPLFSCYVWDRVDWIAPWFTLLKPVSPFVVLSCLSKGAGFHLTAALRTRLGTMLHMCCHRSVSRDITAFALHAHTRTHTHRHFSVSSPNLVLQLSVRQTCFSLYRCAFICPRAANSHGQQILLSSWAAFLPQIPQ